MLRSYHESLHLGFSSLNSGLLPSDDAAICVLQQAKHPHHIRKPSTVAELGTDLDRPSTDDLAREVYNYTGETGTYRYMAPEVFRHEPYNAKVCCFGCLVIIICFWLASVIVVCACSTPGLACSISRPQCIPHMLCAR